MSDDAESEDIGKETMTAFQRWELPDISAPGKNNRIGPLTAKQIDKLQQQAYKEGFDKGLADGYAQGQTQLHAALRELAVLMEALCEPSKLINEEVETCLVQLTTALVQHVLRKEIDTDPSLLTNIIHQAKQILPSTAKKVTLILNPDDLALLTKEGFIENYASDWMIKEDASLLRGGYRIESDASKIDGTVEQLITTVFGQCSLPPSAPPADTPADVPNE